METWNLRQDDTRQADSLPTFIIFCEDGEIEPEYFNAFATKKIQISPIRNCGKQHKQVDYATAYCLKNDLLELKDGRYVLKLDNGAQVWCVFDRDKEENDNQDISFTNSIDSAKSIGFKVAWSNDDFELWILLHFEDVPVDDLSFNSRKKYYERLTEILKAINPKNDMEEKVIGNSKFSYYDSMKSKKRFIGITFQHMKGKTEVAIERAKVLEAFHATSSKPHHEKRPSTLVHHLVEEIIRLGGKTV